MTRRTAAEHGDEVTAPEGGRFLYSICRWTTAVILLQYGFAKLFGAQFTVLDSELDKPMGAVSGFWLTWYYFGYSPIFGNLIALLQIGLGMALAFRRTTLLGAAGAAPLLAGITVLDIAYGIAFDALLVALIGAGCASCLLWKHRRELVAVFWNDQNRIAPRSRRVRPRWAHTVLVTLLLAVPASCSYYVANYNNRAPTPLDGTWNVTAGTFRPLAFPVRPSASTSSTTAPTRSSCGADRRGRPTTSRSIRPPPRSGSGERGSARTKSCCPDGTTSSMTGWWSPPRI